MSDVTGAGMTVDDEDDAEMGRGVAAAIGGGVAGDVILNWGDVNEDDEKAGNGWDSNDDNVQVEVIMMTHSKQYLKMKSELLRTNLLIYTIIFSYIKAIK